MAVWCGGPPPPSVACSSLAAHVVCDTCWLVEAVKMQMAHVDAPLCFWAGIALTGHPLAWVAVCYHSFPYLFIIAKCAGRYEKRGQITDKRVQLPGQPDVPGTQPVEGVPLGEGVQPGEGVEPGEGVQPPGDGDEVPEPPPPAEEKTRESCSLFQHTRPSYLHHHLQYIPATSAPVLLPDKYPPPLKASTTRGEGLAYLCRRSRLRNEGGAR